MNYCNKSATVHLSGEDHTPYGGYRTNGLHNDFFLFWDTPKLPHTWRKCKFDMILCLGIIMTQFIYYSHGISRLLKMYWQSHHLSLKLSKQIKTSVNNWKTYAVWIIKSPRQNWRQINIIGVLGAHKYRGMQGKMVYSKWPNIN